jgi:hypothetical protein
MKRGKWFGFRNFLVSAGTARCAVMASGAATAAFSGATSVVGRCTVNVPPALRAVTPQRGVPTGKMSNFGAWAVPLTFEFSGYFSFKIFGIYETFFIF